MPISDRDRNRLAALTSLIRPAHSLAAKLRLLTDEQRAHYDCYAERMREFIARNDTDGDGGLGNAYAMTLREYGPRLPDTIATALFGKPQKILKADTDDDAARKWMENLQ